MYNVVSEEDEEREVAGVRVVRGPGNRRDRIFVVRSVLLQLVFSACVAAVKCGPVLHHCVVLFYWFSGIMDCMLFTLEIGIPLIC